MLTPEKDSYSFDSQSSTLKVHLDRSTNIEEILKEHQNAKALDIYIKEEGEYALPDNIEN